jgi:hypothetical protein
MTRLEQMERAAKGLGHSIKSAIPKWAGFCLLVFDFGDGGNLTYISNAQRADMVKTLREAADKIEKRLEYPKVMQ